MSFALRWKLYRSASVESGQRGEAWHGSERHVCGEVSHRRGGRRWSSLGALLGALPSDDVSVLLPRSSLIFVLAFYMTRAALLLQARGEGIRARSEDWHWFLPHHLPRASRPSRTGCSRVLHRRL